MTHSRKQRSEVIPSMDSRPPLLMVACLFAILSVVPTAMAQTPTYQINSGGPAVAPFSADAFFSGGQTASTTATIDTSAVTNPAPTAVYQTERWGGDSLSNPAPFSYTFPNLTAGASYTVRLHFAEIFWTAAGQRKFNVSINGTQVLTNFDIIATAGAANKANVQQFTTTANSSGQIVVSFTVGTADAPKVSGIEIIKAASGLPAGWSDLDIGGPGLAGSASFNGGTFTVQGSGADIWSTSDQFHYAFQAANGDLTITARVASQQNTNAWAKSGVMVRETTAANSAYVFMMVTPGNGVSMQYRSSTGASAASLGNATGPVAPYWVRLQRAGNTFTGFSSADGVTWSQFGTINVTMAASVNAGLAVTAHNNTALSTSTFDNVSLTGPSPDFTLSATPASQTVTAGNGTSYTASVNPVNGFTGSVNLTVSGLPNGATGSLSPNPVTSGSSTLTVSTSTSTPAGTYTLTITGTSGSLTHSANVTLVVNAVAAPDFALSATPASQTVTAGKGTSYTASVNPVNGFTGTVGLTVSGLPSGATGSFNPTSISGGSGSSTLSVSTATSTPPGTYTLTITGTSGSLNHSATVTLVVNSSNVTPAYQINSGGPAVAPFSADAFFSGGQTASTTATVDTSAVTNPAPTAVYQTERWGGDSLSNPAPFSYTFPNLTAGASYTVRLHFAEIFWTAAGQRKFNVSINGTQVLTNFDIIATAGAANKANVQQFTTTANSSGQIVVSYTVGTADAPKSSGIEIIPAGPPVPDFTLSASPSSQTVTAGNGTSYTATVSAMNGFSGSVSLSVSGLPSGTSGSFNPASVTGSGGSTLSVSTSSSTPAGTYTLTISGTSGSLSHSTTVTLTVNPQPVPDFSLAASPSSQTVTAGNGTTYTASVSPINGFNGTVGLNVSGLPSGATGSFSPTSISGGSGSSALSVSTSTSTPAGTYMLTITGSSGTLSHSASVTLVVNTGATGGTTYTNAYITLYGWPDNSPPGNAIAYPKSSGYPTVHNAATVDQGTWNAPDTFATDGIDNPPTEAIGTKIYVPYIQRYYVMEDECSGSGPPIAGTGNCEADWRHNPPIRHIDLWLGGNPPATTSAVLNCENKWTRNPGTYVSAPTNHTLTVNPTPLFNSNTNTCR